MEGLGVIFVGGPAWPPRLMVPAKPRRRQVRQSLQLPWRGPTVGRQARTADDSQRPLGGPGGPPLGLASTEGLGVWLLAQCSRCKRLALNSPHREVDAA